MYFSRKTKKIVIGIILSVFASFISYIFGYTEFFDISFRTQSKTEVVHVNRVIDGDTIELADGRKVRYIGIDAPEIAHGNGKSECFGEEAMVRNKDLVEGRDVRLEKDVSDTDKYGRLLRYVFVEDTFVNNVMVLDGFAEAKRYKPDTAFYVKFFSSQQQAQDEEAGMWTVCRK